MMMVVDGNVAAKWYLPEEDILARAIELSVKTAIPFRIASTLRSPTYAPSAAHYRR